MNKQLLSEQLHLLGLSEDESSIYLFLLENGPRTPLELSRQMDLNRSKIYRLIELMQSKRIIEDTKTAWGQKLVAAPPENLELIIIKEEETLSHKKSILEDLVNDLKELPAGVKSTFQVKHYKGLEGLKQMFWNGLKAKENTLIFGYSSIDQFVGWDFAEKLRQESVERKLHFYEITNSSPSKDWTKVEKFREVYQHTRWISPQKLTINQYTEIHDEHIRVYNWDEKELVGIELINKNLSEMMKQIFWHYWSIARVSSPSKKA